jgi:hypothetical protein
MVACSGQLLLGVWNVEDTIIEWELDFVLSLSSAIRGTLPLPGIESSKYIKQFNIKSSK